MDISAFETLVRIVWLLETLFKISRCIKIKKTKKGFRITMSFPYRNN